ncbi:DUF4232 domain-containing protein [Streptomyces daliensis]
MARQADTKTERGECGATGAGTEAGAGAGLGAGRGRAFRQVRVAASVAAAVVAGALLAGCAGGADGGAQPRSAGSDAVPAGSASKSEQQGDTGTGTTGGGSEGGTGGSSGTVTSESGTGGSTSGGTGGSTSGGRTTTQGGSGDGSGSCATSDLKASIGPNHPGAGQENFALVFTNDSGESCTVRGFPGLAFLNADGEQVSFDPQREGSAGKAVTLAPGKSAWAPLSFSNPEMTGVPTVTPDSVLLTPPDQRTSLKIDWSGGPVTATGKASVPKIGALSAGTSA